MENYREKLKKQNILLSISAAGLLAIQILSFTGVVTPAVQGERWHGFYNGFIAGAAFGIMALFIVGLIMNIRALHNEKYLKKLYIKENDERSCQVHSNGQSSGARIFLVLMLPVSIILGYFNITVFITCISCVLALSVIIGICKLYYSRKL